MYTIQSQHLFDIHMLHKRCVIHSYYTYQQLQPEKERYLKMAPSNENNNNNNNNNTRNRSKETQKKVLMAFKKEWQLTQRKRLSTYPRLLAKKLSYMKNSKFTRVRNHPSYTLFGGTITIQWCSIINSSCGSQGWTYYYG